MSVKELQEKHDAVREKIRKIEWQIEKRAKDFGKSRGISNAKKMVALSTELLALEIVNNELYGLYEQRDLYE